MNATSPSLLQTVLATDPSLSVPERFAIESALRGEVPAPVAKPAPSQPLKFVSQRVAADMLGVSRVTIGRMTRDGLLHPSEILPGTLRYRVHELQELTERYQRSHGTTETSKTRVAA